MGLFTSRDELLRMALEARVRVLSETLYKLSREASELLLPCHPLKQAEKVAELKKSIDKSIEVLIEVQYLGPKK